MAVVTKKRKAESSVNKAVSPKKKMATLSVNKSNKSTATPGQGTITTENEEEFPEGGLDDEDDVEDVDDEEIEEDEEEEEDIEGEDDIEEEEEEEEDIDDEFVDEIEMIAEPKDVRRKIPIKYIDNRTRRQVTFAKRRHGIMKKAYELSVLTGANILLLILGQSGLVYTFSTPKLEPIVRDKTGKDLIRACLNAPSLSPTPTNTPTTN